MSLDHTMQFITRQANQYKGRIAIREGKKAYTYDDLIQSAGRASAFLLMEKKDLQGARIAFMVNPGLDYVAVQWGIWQAGGVAVPICISYPEEAIRYYLEDCGTDLLICSLVFVDLLQPLAAQMQIQLADTGKVLKDQGFIPAFPKLDGSREAMILYTSGTTNKPKGVVTTHSNISSQITTLVEAWEWSREDQIIGFLPLHHVHGIINVLSCALWSGACVHFMPAFEASKVFQLVMEEGITVFMAVPTVYYKLIQFYHTLDPETKQKLQIRFGQFRLMVSGSAALPVSVLDQWKNITGHTLLERYGMTEIGMAISNPMHGTRKPGYVGIPLRGVAVRLVDEELMPVKEAEPGEIQIKGKNVFKEYWKKPAATREAFTADGWFRTGDIAIVESGYYRILGRNSVDIIKSGGYKISALEIEEVLRAMEGVKDVAVVGLPDEEWGEIIGAAIQSPNLSTQDIPALKAWLSKKLPAYKTPRSYRFVPELPRNAMGKVVKQEVKSIFTS